MRVVAFLGFVILGIISQNYLQATENKVKETVKSEIEVKFFIDRQRFENRLQELGARLAQPRRLMRRQVFDFPVALRKPGMEQVGRVRDEGNKITLTIKEYPVPRTMDNVKELEIVVDDFDAAAKVLEVSGYISFSYQENYRTSWILDGCAIEIDEWPGLPVYAEIEAPSVDELKAMAERCGIREADFMTLNLFNLYEKVLGINAKKIRNLKRLTFDSFNKENLLAA